ncbi:MAG TPA: hypothetical protein VFE14_12395 [Micromonosporaceae bacterium]|jgi:hypothetical protein|nr:hypothetical protein [Micromonosporaceae bacterium]
MTSATPQPPEYATQPAGQTAPGPAPQVARQAEAPAAEGTQAPKPPPAVTASLVLRSAAHAGTVATAASPFALAAPAAEAIADELVAIPDTTRVQPPRPSPVPERPRPPDVNGHRGRAGRLDRLRVGSHMVSPAALSRMGFAVPGGGLVVGADRRQRPVSVRFFRPEPTKITVVGGAWAGQLIAFRALAMGARAAVVTVEPSIWNSFGEWATKRTDRVVVWNQERPVAVAGTAAQPTLLVYDLGVAGPATPPPLGPWQTQLTVLRELDHAGVPSVQEGHLVLLQRLDGAEAGVAGTALRLPEHSVGFLQLMADDMLAVVGGGAADQYVWLTETDVERTYFGDPRR